MEKLVVTDQWHRLNGRKWWQISIILVMCRVIGEARHSQIVTGLDVLVDGILIRNLRRRTTFWQGYFAVTWAHDDWHFLNRWLVSLHKPRLFAEFHLVEAAELEIQGLEIDIIADGELSWQLGLFNQCRVTFCQSRVFEIFRNQVNDVSEAWKMRIEINFLSQL